MAGVESMIVEDTKPAEKPVDREKVCYIALNLLYFSLITMKTPN